MNELTNEQIIEKVKGDWNAAQPTWNCWDNFTERDHLLAVAAAVRAQRQAGQEAVAAESRFHGQGWRECTVQHAAMVIAAPHEWNGYEVRLLYIAPPAAPVPEGYKLVPIEPTPTMAAAAHRWEAAGVKAVYRAMLKVAPQPIALFPNLQKAVREGLADGSIRIT